MSAVSIHDLGWKYSGRKHFAIEHVNLEIPENSFVSVVGPNEHGKTTLVSCIKGPDPQQLSRRLAREPWKFLGRMCAR